MRPRTAVGMLGALTAALVLACTPAQQAEMSQVEQIVLQDVLAQKPLPQIEADVATAVAGKPGTDVVLLVDDALTLILDLHLVPANLVPYVHVLVSEEHPKAAAHRSESDAVVSE